MLSKLVTTFFLVLIALPPLAQAAWELSRGQHVQALDVFGPLESARLRNFEKGLREASYVHQRLTPWYQLALLELFSRGNEKSVVGDEGWLFFTENLDYVTRPPFRGVGSEAVEDTIADFAAQLDARGIALVVVPVPAKVAIQPAKLSFWTRDLSRAEQSASRELFASLGGAAAVWEPGAGGELAYLSRDTHWTPESMQLVAGEVAALGRQALEAAGSGLERAAEWRRDPLDVSAAGDLTNMLRLPPGREVFAPMALGLQQVKDAASGALFTPEREAEVLLLGDSFTLAFSDPRLGMGESAGFAEQLAFELGVPLDVIALAGGSARAVREALARREEGLAGKKLVVWQLSMRDFIGDPGKWTRVELPAGGPAAVQARGPLRVRAEITEITRIPEEFEYEFCLAIHEYRVLEVLEGELPEGPLWVGHVAIRDFASTPHASYEVGQRHLLELEDVALFHDLEQTSWMDSTDSNPRAVIWFPTGIEDDE